MSEPHDCRLRSGPYLGEISALCFLHLPPPLSSLPYLLAGISLPHYLLLHRVPSLSLSLSKIALHTWEWWFVWYWNLRHPSYKISIEQGPVRSFYSMTWKQGNCLNHLTCFKVFESTELLVALLVAKTHCCRLHLSSRLLFLGKGGWKYLNYASMLSFDSRIIQKNSFVWLYCSRYQNLVTGFWMSAFWRWFRLFPFP